VSEVADFELTDTTFAVEVVGDRTRILEKRFAAS
jgi:hypothetical protein